MLLLLLISFNVGFTGVVPTKKEEKRKKKKKGEVLVLVVAGGYFRDGAELKAVGDASGRGAGGKVVVV